MVLLVSCSQYIREKGNCVGTPCTPTLLLRQPAPLLLLKFPVLGVFDVQCLHCHVGSRSGGCQRLCVTRSPLPAKPRIPIKPVSRVQVGQGLQNPNLYLYPQAPVPPTHVGSQTHDIPYPCSDFSLIIAWDESLEKCG